MARRERARDSGERGENGKNRAEQSEESSKWVYECGVFYTIIVSKSLEASKILLLESSAVNYYYYYFKPNCRRRTTKTKWIDEMKGLTAVMLSMVQSLCDGTYVAQNTEHMRNVFTVVVSFDSLDLDCARNSVRQTLTSTTTTSLVFLHHRFSQFFFSFFVALLKLVTHLHLMKISCMHFRIVASRLWCCPLSQQRKTRILWRRHYRQR